jgi:hypothetical protein
MTPNDIVIIRYFQGKIKSHRDLDREVCKALNLPHVAKHVVVGW